MLRLEAEWLGERMARIPDKDLFPLLDLGSSTLEYRTQTQPYIERNIFAPLRARGGVVYHLDMKSDPGVDVVGNLEDPEISCSRLAHAGSLGADVESPSVRAQP